MHAFDIAIVAAYVVGIVVFGVLVSRRIRTFRDYFVAGGRMTTPLLICTLVSTYYGLDVLLGSSEVSYQEGIVSWFAYARPYYLAILIAAFTIARRLRRFDVLSLPDVAGLFYGRSAQGVLAVATFLYALPILAFMGMGVVLDVTLGVPFVWGVLLGAAVSVVYTVMGGLLADALTDTVQFTLMCVTLGLAAVVALHETGGVAALQERLAPSFFEPTGSYPAWVLVVFAGTALSATVEPAFYQRILAAKTYRSIVVALLVGIVLWAAFDWVVAIVGMLARATGLETEPRYALVTMTLQALPVGLKGLFVASVLATAMSTVDSYLLIAGGNLSYDLYRPFARRPLSDAELLRLTRWMIVVSAVVTVALALFFQTVVSAWVFMSTTLVAAAFVPIVGALYLPRHATPAAGCPAAWLAWRWRWAIICSSTPSAPSTRSGRRASGESRWVTGPSSCGRSMRSCSRCRAPRRRSPSPWCAEAGDVVDLAFWTDLAIWTLVVLPLVVFAWFLHGAAALLREIKEAHEKRVES